MRALLVRLGRRETHVVAELGMGLTEFGSIFVNLQMYL